jgi:Flp pilus assembly protein TadD
MRVGPGRGTEPGGDSTKRATNSSNQGSILGSRSATRFARADCKHFRTVRHLTSESWPVLFALLIASILAGIQPASAQTWNPETALSAALTVEYFDAEGTPIRSTNGTLIRQGLVVPLTALSGAATARAIARDGKSWTSEQLIAVHPEADLALLPISDIPAYAIDVPRNAAFVKNAEVVLLRGPGGAGAETVTVTAYGKFSIRGPDFLALSEGLPSGAPGFRSDGTLLGICFDVSEGGTLLDYLVTTASVQNLIAGRGEPIALASYPSTGPPQYQNASTLDGMVFRGALLATTGRTQEARTFLDQALVLMPTNPVAHHWWGRALFEDGQHEEAAISFQKAAELDPSYHLAWHMAGAAMHQAGHFEEALALYQRALEAYPESALTWCNIGSTQFHVLHFAEAEEAFSMAMQLDPSYSLPYFNLAMLYRQQGRGAEAESLYVKLQEVDPAWAERLRRALDDPGS